MRLAEQCQVCSSKRRLVPMPGSGFARFGEYMNDNIPALGATHPMSGDEIAPFSPGSIDASWTSAGGKQ